MAYDSHGGNMGGDNDDKGSKGSSGADKGSSGSDKGSSGSDKGSSGADKGNGGGGKHDSPGPIGGHDSYGMDKDSFDNSIGRDNTDRGGKGNRPSSKVVEAETSIIHDAWTSVKNFFGGEEDTGGFSPMGGPSSYGMEKKTFDRTIGSRRQAARSLDERLLREIDYFKEAPMDYAADLIDNPMVNLGLAMSGLGMTAFGIKAVDAVMDAFQGESTLAQSATSIAGNAISSTPIGATLGPARDLVASTLKDPDSFAGTVGGMLGGRLGGVAGSKVAAALTDNPYARAALTAGTAASAAAYAGGWVSEKQQEAKQLGGTQVAQNRPQRESGAETKRSPLASSGERAVQASERLMQPAQADLYARTVEALPFYGLNQQQLPFYGV